MKIFLRPKNIVVVGGGSGIGFAAAQKLLDSGASSVILASRNLQKLQNAKNALKFNSSQKVIPFEFDAEKVQTHAEAILKMQELVLEETENSVGGGGMLDGLVISCGVNFDGSNWKGFNVSEEDWDRVIGTNLKGPFFLLRNFSNFLYARGIKGNICVVSSISAHRDLLSPYQISKNAITGIVHAYGKFLCERGVVLNGIEPGSTDTDMMKHLAVYTDGIRQGKKWLDNSIGRVLRAEEMAEIIFFLMSNLGETMSGTCVLAGGGCKGLHWN